VEVLKRVVRSRTIIIIVNTIRKKNWVGPVMRGNGLLKEVMEGIMLNKGRLSLAATVKATIRMLEELIENNA